MLLPSMSGKSCYLNDIELMGIIRQARELSDAGHRYLLEGLTWLIKGDIDKGVDMCEKAIAHNDRELVPWTNYAVVLSSKCHFKMAMNVISRSVEKRMPLMLLHAFHYASRWADYRLMALVLPLIEETKVHESITGVLKDAWEKSLNTYDQLLDMGISAADEMSRMASAVMEIAEEEKLPLVSTRTTNDGDGNYAYIYGVDTLDPIWINHLDNMLFDRLILKGIKSRHCIAFFESVAEEAEDDASKL